MVDQKTIRDIEIALQRKIYSRQSNFAEIQRKNAADLREFFAEEFKKTATYTSLVSGQLRADFGLSENSVSHLSSNLEKLIRISYEVKRTKVISFITNISPSDDINEFSYYSNEYFIPWMQWLLFAGTSVVVSEYKVTYKSGVGRSKMAIMTKPKDGGSFAVPAEFAGTSTSNWIIRTIESNQDKVKEIIKKNYMRLSSK